MTPITRSDVVAAKNNDISAVTKIMDELLPLIDNVADGIGRRVGRPALAEDLAAEGRLKLWEEIAAHKDDDTGTAPIAGQLVRRVQSHMENKVTEAMSPGVNYRAVQRYAQCLSAAGGDHETAVQLVQNLPKRQRLSRELAEECRAASQTHISMDAYSTFGPGGLVEQVSRDANDAEEVSPNSIRAAYVNATLDQMSAKQARVLREVYMHQLPIDVIAEEWGATHKQVNDHKTVARKNFHAKFPFETVYGAPKPALVAEHTNAKSVRGAK